MCVGTENEYSNNKMDSNGLGPTKEMLKLGTQWPFRLQEKKALLM